MDFKSKGSRHVEAKFGEYGGGWMQSGVQRGMTALG
jgi:hypothetical protein